MQLIHGLPLRSVKGMPWIVATKVPYLSLLWTFSQIFSSRVCFTFIGEFVFTDPANVSLPGSSTVVETRSTTNYQSERYALRPRIVLQSEGIDFHLYRKCILLRRKFIAEQFGEKANPRKDKASDPNGENSSNSGKEPSTGAGSYTPAENGAKRIKLSVTDGK